MEGKSNNRLVYKSNLNTFDYINLILYLSMAFFLIISLYGLVLVESICNKILLLALPLFLIVQAVRTFKVFILFENRLLIKRPLSLKLFNNFYSLSDIKEIEFKSLKGMHKGNILIVWTKYTSSKKDESFSFNLRKDEVCFFSENLKKLGIEVKDEGFNY
ncbi:hypothetical protein SGQ44_09290 [Flavobacterium sp. Fl-77]|uniref:Uncharacterized protein n=1 Tax=Flavobacterium flavipigmentatum TaxID=2893884 RepID=A0AAJ2W194_9FLAO|nr:MULTISPECIES: hypothetical protein [unclassified Flavobacterium]MDX6182137.1 hypothetical protein [Flavobacterium sp. Fl-33]MDX6185950.1 hypothetical protein [Flavobacterium sp. Fl-77]UFH39126.1 hypothetical protein LNP22_02340 [Flavobacterium sp. F-70]